MMLLHAGEPLAPHDLWSAWSFEPGVVIPLALTGAIYARGIRESLHRATRSTHRINREMMFFVSGFVVLALTLVSPVHVAGGVLFSAHMIQHELLMAVAAPLLVLGRPAIPLLFGLPERMRRPVGHAFASRIARGVWSALTTPLVAFLLHAFAIWIWHAPGLYDASVTSDTVHTAQHVSFLATALLFWWSVFPLRDRKGSEGLGIISLFLTGIHTTLLGALLTVSDSSIYVAYREAATQPWGLTTLEDQQLGGLIMWVPGGLAYLAAALYLMLKWIRDSGERAASRDAGRRTRIKQAAGTVAAMLLLSISSGCTNHDTQWAAEMTGGTPSRGKQAMRSYGCQSCHTIPGVAGAKALVGPPLKGIASRSYIAGVLSNTPDHMIEWLRNPPAVDSKTAMPNMNVTERDARDMAAYLYTLR
jgi:putative membrane protein